MTLRLLTLFCCLSFTLMTSAQISGGQIRRSSPHSSQNNQATKKKPVSSNRNYISEPDGYANGHGYVDLGLPSKTKWATCNVGANSPEESGHHLGWGETEPKVAYETRLFGIAIDDISDSEIYDVAKIRWGNGWTIPTKQQWKELIQHCKYKGIERNGIYGYLFTGKNGKSIFLPAAGRRKSGFNPVFPGWNYWSSNADYRYRYEKYYNGYENAYSTCFIIFYEDSKIFDDAAWRDNGYSIRPVYKY